MELEKIKEKPKDAYGKVITPEDPRDLETAIEEI